MEYPFEVREERNQKLFVDWVGFLCDRGLGGAPRQGGVSGNYSIGLADGTDLAIRFEAPKGRVVIEQSSGVHDLAPIVKEAFERGRAGEFDSGAWFSVVFECKPGMEMMPLHMPRSLGEHKRFQGDWALATDCLLTFSQENLEEKLIVLPRFSVEVLFRVASPWHGPYGKQLALETGTLARSICAFASGAAFHPLSPPPWPLKPDQVLEVKEKLAKGVGFLVVDDLPIGPAIMGLQHPRGDEAIQRVTGALFAYEQAIFQPSEYVAMILLVTALEALTVPNTEWRKQRLTKRFVEGVHSLCVDYLERLMTDDAFTKGFGDMKRPRDFLGRLYDERSRPLHSGHVPHGVFDFSAMADSPASRIAVTSELVRNAVLAFLRTPMSSLYGHPVIDPEPRTV